MKALKSLLLPLLLLACSGNGGPADPVGPPPAASCTFTNPLAPGADPWVVRHGGSYYLVESRDGGIVVHRTNTLTQPKQNSVQVWTPPPGGWNQTNLWAPELHRIGDRWYIYYTAGRPGPQGAPFIHQRSGVLESVGDDPQGGYVDKGMLYTGDDVRADTGHVWSIDLTVADLGGRLYAMWSGWERNTTIARTPQHLYIAPMSNPWTISGDRVRISSPTESWERKADPVDGLDLQEGPQFLLNGDRTFVVYSTRESWLREYRQGQLRLRSPGADPLDPASWIKTGPVFSGTDFVYGVGHVSFTKSPDGTEDWILYHTKTSTTPGWDRVIHAQKFGWKADGSPDFGVPVPAGQRIPRPAGECVG